MELAQILKILWDRKVWLALVALLALLASLSTILRIGPGGIEERSHTYGAAQAQFLIDSPRSSLIDLTQDTEALATRAQVYAQFMRSNAVKVEIARIAGIDADRIVAQGPYTTAGGTQNIPRPAPVRSNEVRGEGDVYRLVFDAQLGLPIVSVYAQAPTAEEAIKLADATVEGIGSYVSELEDAENVPYEDQTEIRELGPAEGGTVNPGVDPVISLLVFLAALVAGCAAILAAVALRQGFYRLAAQAEPVADEEPDTSLTAAPGPKTKDDELHGLEPEVTESFSRLSVEVDGSSHSLAFGAIDRLVGEGLVDERTAGRWKQHIEEESPVREAAR